MKNVISAKALNPENIEAQRKSRLLGNQLKECDLIRRGFPRVVALISFLIFTLQFCYLIFDFHFSLCYFVTKGVIRTS